MSEFPEQIPIDPRSTNRAWGVIHPTDSGIWWQVKGAGPAIAYRLVEGVFFPWPRPVADGEDLLQKLHDANEEMRLRFDGDVDSWTYPEDVWQEIQDAIGIAFRFVSPPDDAEKYLRGETAQVHHIEGFHWIVVEHVENEHRDGWIEELPQPLILVPGNSD